MPETKTRLCRVPEDTFIFLSYRFGRCYSPKSGRAFIGIYPSERSVHRLCRSISDATTRKWAWLEVADQIKRLNSRLRGWAEYFRLGWVSAPYQAVKHHTCYRLRQWLGNKYAKRIWAAHYPDSYLHGELGLIDLAQVHKARRISCATA